MIRAVIEDQGSWREPMPSADRGRGITLMNHLMHSAELESDAGGTRVTLVLHLRAKRGGDLTYAPAAPSA